MAKILIVGVGNSGRNIAKALQKEGVPEADYVTFGKYVNDDSDIPHHNLLEMTDEHHAIVGASPERMREIAELAKEEIHDILRQHLEK